MNFNEKIFNQETPQENIPFICSYCGNKFGSAKIEGSHGVCPECAPKAEKDINIQISQLCLKVINNSLMDLSEKRKRLLEYNNFFKKSIDQEITLNTTQKELDEISKKLEEYQQKQEET